MTRLRIPLHFLGDVLRRVPSSDDSSNGMWILSWASPLLPCVIIKVAASRTPTNESTTSPRPKTAPFPRPARNSHYPSFLHCSLLLSVVRPSLSHRKPHQIIRITLGDPQASASAFPSSPSRSPGLPPSGSLWQENPIAQPRGQFP